MQVSAMAVFVGEDWERKCADTTDTVLVPWAGHPQYILKVYIFIHRLRRRKHASK